MVLTTSVSTSKQAEAALRSEARRIYLESAFFGVAEWEHWTSVIHEAGKEAFLAFPAIFRVKAESYFNDCLSTLKKARFDGFLLRKRERNGRIGHTMKKYPQGSMKKQIQ